MTGHPRHIQVRRLIIAILLLFTAACSGAITGKPTPPSPPDPLPGDLLVFRVTYSPGLSPQLYYLTRGPALSIYGDGRVMTTLIDYPTIPQLEVGHLAPVDVARFVADARATTLMDPGTDYGEPEVTDLAGTSVLLNDGEQEYEVSVYALGVTSGLSYRQRERRQQLQEIVDEAFALATTSPATPERIQVMSGNASGYEADAPWPGPEPSTFMTDSSAPTAKQCGVLEGATAAAVYDAAVAKGDQLWLVNGAPALLVVRPLLPDESGCE